MKNYLTLNNLGWILISIVAAMLGIAGISKLMGTEEMVKNFTFMNLLPFLALLGMVELAGAILLVIPKTSKYGVILLSSYLSGAVAIHLSMMGGAGVLTPIFLGLVAWAGYCLRAYTKE